MIIRVTGGMSLAPGARKQVSSALEILARTYFEDPVPQVHSRPGERRDHFAWPGQGQFDSRRRIARERMDDDQHQLFVRPDSRLPTVGMGVVEHGRTVPAAEPLPDDGDG